MILALSSALACDLRLIGHVSDAVDQPIADAAVRVDGREVHSAEDGRFVVDGVCPGHAALTVLHPAFEPYRQALVLPVDHLDIVLSPDEEVVVVESEGPHGRDPHASRTLEGAALERTRGLDLAEALSNEPGVTVLRTTGDASKPMVRGLYGRRLLLLRDGFRHHGQKWGDDHAPEVDPLATGSIRVIRGASGVRYGPDALGGVILLEPEPLQRTGGRVDLIAVDNGGRGVAGAQLDVVTKRLALRLQGNLSKGRSLHTPDYLLGNTASQVSNLGVTLRWSPEPFTLELGWRHHDFRAGLCLCLRSENPDALREAFDAEQPLGSDAWKNTYTIERPSQKVTHDLAYVRLATFLGAASLELAYDLQVNHRQEFDRARQAVTGPQFDFRLITHSVDAELVHKRVHLGSLGTLEGSLGLTGVLQDNLFEGLPLVPNHRALTGGAHAQERLSFGHALVEVGARFDHQHRDTYLTDQAFDRHVRRGTIDPDSCTVDDAAHCPLSWTAGSITAGTILHDRDERFEVRLDLSTANRFPNGDELFLNGSAPSQPVYGLGAPDLRVETTWGISPTLGLDLPWLQVEVAGFANRIDGFINFAPVIQDGQLAIDVTSQGAFPRYSFVQTDAHMLGGEAFVQAELSAWLSLRVQGSMLRAAERGTGAFLPRMPADRALARLALHPPRLGPVDGAAIGVDVSGVARQHRSDATTDLAPAPPGYVLLGADLQVPVDLDGPTLQLGVSAHNLLNQRVRSYTSALRFFADDPGREVRVRIGFLF